MYSGHKISGTCPWKILRSIVPFLFTLIPPSYPPVRTLPVIAQRLAIFSSRTFQKGQFEVKQARPLNCPSFFRRILRYGGKLDNYLKSKYIFLFFEVTPSRFYFYENGQLPELLIQLVFQNLIEDLSFFQIHQKQHNLFTSVSDLRS